MSQYAEAPTDAPADPLDDFETVHLYPRDLRYRRSGAPSPQIGDIALCGWVKQFPPIFPPFGSENCLMCIRLDQLGGAA